MEREEAKSQCAEADYLIKVSCCGNPPPAIPQASSNRITGALSVNLSVALLSVKFTAALLVTATTSNNVADGSVALLSVKLSAGLPVTTTTIKKVADVSVVDFVG